MSWKIKFGCRGFTESPLNDFFLQGSKFSNERMLSFFDCFLLKGKFTVQSLNEVNLVAQCVFNFKAFLSFNLDFPINQIDTFYALIISFL